MQTSLPTSYSSTAVYIPERVFLSTSQKLNQINQVLGIRAVCVASVEVGEEDLRKGKHAEHQHAVGRNGHPPANEVGCGQQKLTLLETYS